MHLTTFQVTNFRRVEDSGPISVGQLSCLVGKNEAGKTALLHALAGLNAHPPTPLSYEVERDYPRRHLNDYQRQERTEEAVVVTTSWSLDEEEAIKVASMLGSRWSNGGPIKVLRRYDMPQTPDLCGVNTGLAPLVDAACLGKRDTFKLTLAP
jgi:ABC-type glutathione transport system ATPase component